MIQGFTRFYVRGVCSLLALLLSACEVGLSSIVGFIPTPVCREIVADNITRAMQLINEGADPNAGNGCALVAAASRGQLQLVELLLERGANPNRTAAGDLTVVMGGATPLVAAVQSRDVRVVRLLLEREANPRNDFDAFQIVINFSDVAMAELLLRYGADANMKRPGDEPVYYFVEIRPRESQQRYVPPRDLEPDRIDETMKRLQCKVFTSRGETLLNAAVRAGGVGDRAGRERIAQLLVEHGADPNVPRFNGETPLMTASRWTGNPRTVSMLKAAGADVNAMDRCGRTAEDYAKMFPTR